MRDSVDVLKDGELGSKGEGECSKHVSKMVLM